MSKIQKNKVGAWAVIKEFCSYYKPYMFILFMDLFCALVLAAVDLAFPQLLRFFTNDFFNRSAVEIFNSLLPIAILLLVMYLIRTASQYYITR